MEKFLEVKNLLLYGKYKLEETKAPEGYLTDGAKTIEFPITENGKIVVLTDEKYSLQGTTQGRYLTGGVPPVRFSM